LSLAGSLHAQPPSHADMHHDVQHEHQGSATSPTFAELEATAAQLQQARHATEKYRDVQQAEADGYRAIGPDVAGMGIHFVRQGHGDGGFSVERPAILLFESLRVRERKRQRRADGFSMSSRRRAIHRPHAMDGPRVDLEGQSARRLQPDQSDRALTDSPCLSTFLSRESARAIAWRALQPVARVDARRGGDRAAAAAACAHD